LCMNYVEGGKCHVTRGDCLLGTSHGLNGHCALHGVFDVWITCDDKILISDIGSPSPEPKRSVALGVGKRVADEVAMLAGKETSGEIITTEQKCRECGRLYWISEHDDSTVTKLGRRHFCPACIGKVQSTKGLGFDLPQYWCG